MLLFRRFLVCTLCAAFVLAASLESLPASAASPSTSAEAPAPAKVKQKKRRKKRSQGSRISAPARTRPAPAWAKHKFKVGRDMTLGEISMRLYGKARKWRKIAEWNDLKPPYALKPGMLLGLRDKPTLTPEEGDRAVLAMWRKVLKVDEDQKAVAKRGAPAMAPAPVVAVTPIPAPTQETILEVPKLNAEEEAKLREQGEKDRKLKELREAEEKRERELAALRAQMAKAESAERERKERELEELRRRQEEERIEAERQRQKREAELAVLIAAQEKAKEEAVFGDEEAEEAEERKDPESPLALLEEGKALFEKKELEAALTKFRRSRELDSEPLLPWFFEIRILRQLKREDEAKETGRALMDEHPQTKNLPLLKFMNEGGGS